MRLIWEVRMFTAVYSLGKVIGARNWVFGFFICAAVYLLVCLIPKVNRTRNGYFVVLMSLLSAEILCDAAWFMAFYSGGKYHNYGLVQGVCLTLLWPALLIAAGIVGTSINKVRLKSHAKHPGGKM